MRRFCLAVAVITGPAEAQLIASPRSIAALPVDADGPGARMPFDTYEAEDAATTGTIVGPDRTFGSLAAEASGRRAVRLEKTGDAVEFVLARSADALTLRYAIPDAPDGRGLDSMIGLYADGDKIADVPLTSRYSWYYGAYPFTNRPADGRAHHFHDHVRMKLGRVLPVGTRLSLRRDRETPATWTVIDLIDLERVPAPKSAPSGALSVIAFGADPLGARSSAAAFDAALAAGRRARRPVWVPPGEYRIDRHLVVDRVALLGAGHWHSVLRGRGIGLYGKLARQGGSRDVTLRDLAIIGEVGERVDRQQLSGIGGALSRSTVSDLWLQHHKVGLWLDGPLHRLTISRVRIYDQTADGVNFHTGVTDSVVEDSFIRNVGDDGLAMWSHRRENAGNVFRRNTVISPLLANGIAIYGGRDIAVTNNLVADTVTQGGGLHLGSRFDATPFRGHIAFSGNKVVRGGVLDPNWKFGIGAFWIYALDHPITGARVTVSDMALIDSSYEAIQLLGKPITGVTFADVVIRGTGTSALQLQAPGSATFRNVVATGLGGSGVAADASGFVVQDGGGNRGWETRTGMGNRGR